MKLELLIAGDTVFTLVDEERDDRLFRIPGSKLIQGRGKKAEYNSQQIAFDDFEFALNNFYLQEKITVSIKVHCFAYILRFVISGAVESNNKTILRKDYFSITSVNENHFDSYIICQDTDILEICYPSNVFESILKMFPLAAEKLENSLTNNNILKESFSFAVNPSTALNIHRLIHSPYSAEIKEYHIDLIQTLLEQALVIITNNTDIRFSRQEAEQIQTAITFINQHLSQHYTIAEISKVVGLNKQKLKYGFKQMTGKGLYGYLQNQKLTLAKSLLLQSRKSVKEIGYEIGFKTPNNFSAFFKNAVGQSPLAFRKNNFPNSKL